MGVCKRARFQSNLRGMETGSTRVVHKGASTFQSNLRGMETLVIDIAGKRPPLVSIESKRNGNSTSADSIASSIVVSIESKRNGNIFSVCSNKEQIRAFQSNLRGMETQFSSRTPLRLFCVSIESKRNGNLRLVSETQRKGGFQSNLRGMETVAM